MTFDTEFEDDAAAIDALKITVPATYFWTGSYARKYPDLLRRLASQGHQIGAHSFYHDDLTTLTPGQVQFDLKQTKTLLEAVARVPVTAFRAPYLTYTDAVMQGVADLGFRIDSSEESPWPRNRRLPEVAISAFENLLVSDYDIFDARGLDDATALDFLIRAYDQHAARGQPFVLLFHPRIIRRHADVIRKFIDHVEKTGGTFRTIDTYLDSLTLAPKVPRLGLWAGLGPDDQISDVLAAAQTRGATDLYLTLPDVMADRVGGPTRTAAAVAAVQARGIRVHLAFPVTQNPALAALLPQTLMRDARGRPRPGWVSPSHPEARRHLIAKAADLVAKLGVDGLYLYGLGYPGLDCDFSPAALQRFSAVSAISGVTPGDILHLHYLGWTQWRAAETALLVAEIAAAARTQSAGVAISVALPAAAATDYRAQELSGLDFRRIGAGAAAIILSPPPEFALLPPALLPGPVPPRSLLATRSQAGAVPIFLLRPDGPAGAGPPGLDRLFGLGAGMVVDLRRDTGRRSGSLWPDLTLPPAPAR